MARHGGIEGNSMVTAHVYRAEEGGYWAEMPEDPECYTQAETMDELEESVREAVQCYIDASLSRRHGRAVAPTTTYMSNHVNE